MAHEILQDYYLNRAIVYIDDNIYRAFNIRFKSVGSIQVTLALDATLVCETLKLYIMCVVLTYFIQIMYNIIICFVCLLISSSDTYFCHIL